MKDEEFPLSLELRIDWSDQDYFKHVNNISIFKYVQASRVNFLEHIGLTKLHLETNRGPVLASSKCDFLIPLFYPGKISVLAKTDFIKKTSFGILHHILDNDKRIAAVARDVIVMFDYTNNEKYPIPKDIETALRLLMPG